MNHAPLLSTQQKMIISISRRTDIPAFYSEWLFRRLREGFADVSNPRNPAQTRRISLKPQDVDGVVFWSKDPSPMLPRLNELAAYRYYVQFTLTPYGAEIEPAFAGKAKAADTFRRLAEKIGPERVLWRYDPVLLNPEYTADRHIESFAGLAARLEGSTRQCTVSFVDAYRNTRANAAGLRLQEIGDEQKLSLARSFADIAGRHGIVVAACAEDVDLTGAGVGRARCVDARLFNALWGTDLPAAKDRNQRPACGCAPSVDVGAYNTCPGGCLYCYANYNPGMITKNRASHDPDSPLFSK